MPRISQRLVIPSADIIKLITLAAGKKMGHLSLVRGMDSGRALDWIIRLGSLDDHSGNPAAHPVQPGDPITSVTIFDDNYPSHHRQHETPRIYTNRELNRDYTLAEITAWVTAQPDGFADEATTQMISEAVNHGWLLSFSYTDYSGYTLGTPAKPANMPDQIRCEARSYNFSDRSRSGETLSISANAGKPEWNVYRYCADGADHQEAPAVNITAQEALTKLSNWAPTLTPLKTNSTPQLP